MLSSVGVCAWGVHGECNVYIFHVGSVHMVCACVECKSICCGMGLYVHRGARGICVVCLECREMWCVCTRWYISCVWCVVCNVGGMLYGCE